MSKHSGQRVIGRDSSGFPSDSDPYCGRWSCDKCWRSKLFGIKKATLIYLAGYKLDEMWVSTMTLREWGTAKRWRSRHRDEGVMAMIASYSLSESIGILSTHNLSPNLMPSLNPKEAVEEWVRLGLKYRPNRVTPDWPIDLPPSENEWIGTISEEYTARYYQLLGERGIPRNEPLDDPHWQRKLYQARADAMQTDSDYLSGGSV